MQRILEKVERRLGEKLGLKGERCSGPKCAMVRRAYPPGVHGKKVKRRRESSEYGTLLREKQKIKYLYYLDDREVKRYNRMAASKPGIFSSHFIRLLESRLDNVVFRLGFVESRRIARQLVSHGHVLVKGKTVNIPSYQVKKDDVISLKERAWQSAPLMHYEARVARKDIPKWLALDKNKKEGKMVGAPSTEDTGMFFDVTKIKEFYSR